MALLGYDFLFPKTAVVALQQLGIKVVATQERFCSGFYKTMAPFMDEYYVQGEVVQRLLEGSPYTHVNKFCIIGDGRVKRIADHKPAAQRERMARFPTYQSVCLVLDFHSDPDPFGNAMLTANNWENNKQFYAAIVKLADANPKSMFVIRGKDTAWLSIPEMADAVEWVRARSNIVIDDRYDALDRSYFLASMSDVVVARYNSLCDQCLAAGIPVLVFDRLVNGARGISEWHDYAPYPIMVYDEETLLARFHETISGEGYMDPVLWAQMRREYYGVNPGDSDDAVQVRLVNCLESALH